MTGNDGETRQALAAVLASLPEVPAGTADTISTPEVLLELARAWPAPPTGERRNDLNALCRKVHVAGKVLAVYLPGWKRGAARDPLPAAFWPLLIAVFLAYSRPPGGGGDERGLALKCLNAAIESLDLARRVGCGEPLAELETWSRRRLETVRREEAE